MRHLIQVLLVIMKTTLSKQNCCRQRHIFVHIATHRMQRRRVWSLKNRSLKTVIQKVENHETCMNCCAMICICIKTANKGRCLEMVHLIVCMRHAFYADRDIGRRSLPLYGAVSPLNRTNRHLTSADGRTVLSQSPVDDSNGCPPHPSNASEPSTVDGSKVVLWN